MLCMLEGSDWGSVAWGSGMAWLLQRPVPMRCARTVPALVLLAAGCVSPFELDVPDTHPSSVTADTSGELVLPDPFHVPPPEPVDGGGMEMDMKMDGHGMPMQGEHGGMR